jgi:hypothetical protein
MTLKSKYINISTKIVDSNTKQINTRNKKLTLLNANNVINNLICLNSNSPEKTSELTNKVNS